MKLRKDLNLYVIGLRRCAEIRVGRKPPVAHTTSFSKVVPVTKPIYTNGVFGRYITDSKIVMKKVEFKQTIWKGGRVLGPISTNALAYIGMYAARDKVVKVPLKFHTRLLEHFNQ